MNLSDLVFIALGSNLGDSLEVIQQVEERLQRLSQVPLLKSSLWQSSPVDCPPGSPDFINGVDGFVPLPGETPESLLAQLQKFEREFGRRPKKVLNEARPLDLDLIHFKGETRNSPSLTLPHPRAHLRRFVLEPLAELAPTLVLPGQDQPVLALLQALPNSERLTRVSRRPVQ
jgi:2-amino-4-hydroxy-6-hydroxymethyldihydropteridine diphosphokinase